MSKRILSCTLALILALGMLLAAAPGVALAASDSASIVTPKGELPIVTEPITLTIGIPPKANVQDFDTNHFTRYVEENTGINLEFFFFPADGKEAAQKLEMMVAAGEKLPDIIGFLGEINEFAKASYGRQGVFRPLNGYMDEYNYFWENNFQTYCDEAERQFLKSMMYSPDGNIYGFPFYSVDPTDAQVECLYMNKVWLDTLGLEVPTTLDELYDVLVAFRDGDPNGNGIADEIPLVGYNCIDNRADLIFYFANSFLYYNFETYGRFYIDENGKLETAYTQEAFREALRYVKKLYDEKLLAPFSFTQDYSQLKAMVDLPDTETTIVGTVAHHPWSGREGFTYNKEGYSKVLDYVAIGPLTGPEGVSWSPYQVTGMRFNTFITRDCEYPEAAYRMLDFMCDPHVSLVSRRGEEGVDWEYVDPSTPGRYQSLGFETIYKVNMDAWAQTEQNSIYNLEFHFLPSRLFAGVQATEFANDVARWREEIYMEGFSRRYGNYPEEIVTNLIYSEEELFSINEIMTDVKEYSNEARILFVTGGMDLDKDWDMYLAELDNMGRQTWLETAQAAYDRMQATK